MVELLFINGKTAAKKVYHVHLQHIVYKTRSSTKVNRFFKTRFVFSELLIVQKTNRDLTQERKKSQKNALVDVRNVNFREKSNSYAFAVCIKSLRYSAVYSLFSLNSDVKL